MTFIARHTEKLLPVNGTNALNPIGIGTYPQYGGIVFARRARLLGFIARNFASSAKAAAGGSTSQRVQIVDGDGKVVYLDAADRDYATGEVRLNIARDTTSTGLTDGTFVDSTGAAFALAADVAHPVPLPRKGPFVVSVLLAEVVTDYFSIDLILEV